MIAALALAAAASVPFVVAAISRSENADEKQPEGVPAAISWSRATTRKKACSSDTG